MPADGSPATRVDVRKTGATFINKPCSFLLEIKTASPTHHSVLGAGRAEGYLQELQPKAAGRGPRCWGLREARRRKARRSAGRRRSVAKGHGLHVKEADVHLGLNVDPLPDLKGTAV